jgi:hypothetical protein
MEAKVGRPRIYDNVEQLEQAILDYFFPLQTNSVETQCGTLKADAGRGVNKKPSVTGLSLSLGFADKTTLYEYRDREEFSYPIKKALTMIEQYHEERLAENNVTGAIFALKNFGWKDKSEVDMTSKGEQITGFNYIPPGPTYETK